MSDSEKEENTNNKTLGLIAKIRNKLGDKPIILIFSLLPYFITYYYQIGFLRHFGISSEFVDFSFQVLLKDTVLAIIIALILFIIIEHMAKNDLPYKKSAVALMSFKLTLCIILLTIASISNADSLNNDVIKICIVAMFVTFIFFCTMSFIVYAIDKLVSCITSFIRKIFNRPKKEKCISKSNTHTDRHFKISTGSILLIATFLFVTLQILMIYLGEFIGNSKTSFMSFNCGTQTYLIISTYKDGILAAEYNSTEKKVSNKVDYFSMNEVGAMSLIQNP